jgi:hypothetical protein
MRNLNNLALALCGLVLAAASIGFAIAEDSPAEDDPGTSSRVFLPAVAGDDSTFDPSQATATAPSNATATVTNTPTATTIPTGCAGPRTPVKILADGGNFDRTPQVTTVGFLLIAERPDGLTNGSARVSPDEERVVEVNASLLGYSRTSSGGIDLAIAMNPGGEAIIASFPGSGCLTETANNEDKGAMNAARLALQQACGNPPDSGAFKPIGGTAKLTGIPFWGKEHTNTLGAPNGIELGPVLSFEFNPATSCDANASKTPYPTATPTPVLQEILIGLLPRFTNPGADVEIVIITVPAVAGKQCGYEIWSAGMDLVASAPLATTGPDGRINWTITIPDDWNGRYTVQPECPGLPVDGSAPLDVAPL